MFYVTLKSSENILYFENNIWPQSCSNLLKDMFRYRVVPCQLTRWCNGHNLRFFSYSHIMYLYKINGYVQIFRLQIAMVSEK